jgi:cadherin-like protein/FG-GAP repeat protein
MMKVVEACLNICIISLLALTQSGCDGGGSSGNTTAQPGPVPTPNPLSTNADLDDIVLTGIDLQQTFQSRQYSYTAAENFLTTSTIITPFTDDESASVTVDGAAVLSGTPSEPVALGQGLNTVEVKVTAEDGVTTNTYIFEIDIEDSESFAQQAYLKADDAESGARFGSELVLYGDTLAVTGGESVYVFVHTDGAWVQQARLEVGGLPKRFGQSIALYEDTLVVGAPGAGAVYVFGRSEYTWKRQALLRGENTEEGDEFGAAVDLRVDTLIVGAPREDSSASAGGSDNSELNSGAAYVFIFTDGEWKQQALVKDSYAAEGDRFGTVLALADDAFAVGVESKKIAPFERKSLVYIFKRSNGAWSQRASISAPEPVRHFGSDVALSGDMLAVAARGAYSPTPFGIEGENGGVYIFIPSDGIWALQARLRGGGTGGGIQGYDCSQDDPFPVEIQNFGASIALSGTNLVVGASWDGSSASGGESDQSSPGAGAAYVFSQDNGQWYRKAFLKASNAEGGCIIDYAGPPYLPIGDGFGQAVAIFGDTIVIGALYEDSSATAGEADNSEQDAGAVYTFR